MFWPKTKQRWTSWASQNTVSSLLSNKNRRHDRWRKSVPDRRYRQGTWKWRYPTLLERYLDKLWFLLDKSFNYKKEVFGIRIRSDSIGFGIICRIRIRNSNFRSGNDPELNLCCKINFLPTVITVLSHVENGINC